MTLNHRFKVLRKRFRPGLRLTLFVMFFLPLTIALGIWQLDRAAQKLELQERYFDEITQLPVTPTEATEPRDFMRLRLRGRLQEALFLVDNQVLERRPGYWAVQILEQAGGDRWLVNRGFFAAPPSRAELPIFAPIESEVELTGVIWPYTGLVPLLADDPWSGVWPERVQRLNIARMAAVTGARNVEVRLERGPYAQRPAPFAAVLSNEKHLGYAATWFGLAIALVVLYGVAGWRRSTKP